MKKAISALVAMLLIVLCPTCSAQPRVGGKAPEINVPDWLNTKPLTLKGLRGKIVVLEFWATWCGPCKTAIPHLIEMNKQYKDKGVVIISITREQRQTVEPFAKKMNMDYPVGMGSQTGGTYGVRGIPHAFVIDPEGLIRWQGHPMGGLDAAIEDVLKKHPPKVDEEKGKELVDAIEKAFKEMEQNQPPKEKQLWASLLEIPKEAKDFAEKYGPESIAFLKSRATTDRGKGTFAMLVLAALGSEERASNALKDLAYSRDYKIDETAVRIISLMPAESARVVAEDIATAPEHFANKQRALGMLRGLGNKETLTRLKKYLEEIEKDTQSTRLKPYLERTIGEIEYRLNEIPTEKEQQAWAHQELVFWRGMMNYRGRRNDTVDFLNIAGLLAAHCEPFSAEFLKRKLATDKQTGYGESEVAALLLGSQKEESAISMLQERIPTGRREIYIKALACMGTDNALRALEKFITPDKTGLTREITTTLATHGDEKSAALLRGLAKDEQFDETSRAHFTKAADEITKRLEEEKRKPAGEEQ